MHMPGLTSRLVVWPPEWGFVIQVTYVRWVMSIGDSINQLYIQASYCMLGNYSAFHVWTSRGLLTLIFDLCFHTALVYSTMHFILSLSWLYDFPKLQHVFVETFDSTAGHGELYSVLTSFRLFFVFVGVGTDRQRDCQLVSGPVINQFPDVSVAEKNSQHVNAVTESAERLDVTQRPRGKRDNSEDAAGDQRRTNCHPTLIRAAITTTTV